MKSVNTSARVMEINKFRGEMYKLRLKSPEISREAEAGQFVHLRCLPQPLKQRRDPFLRRPFSFNSIDPRSKSFAIKFNVEGRGTAALSRRQKGEKLEVMGPLGQGFTIRSGVKNPLIIGGGMGAAPLPPLLDKIPDDLNPRVLLGANNIEALSDYCFFKEREDHLDLTVVTENGGIGEKGIISQYLSWFEGDIDYVYACGPLPMIKAVKSWSEKNDIRGQVSLESRMACGVGACLSCVRKIKEEGSSNIHFKNVCSEGPVFPLERVIFDD